MKTQTTRTSFAYVALAWTSALIWTGCAGPKLQAPVPMLDALEVLPASGLLDVGRTASLGAQRLKAGAATNVTGDVEWESDDEDVLRVSYDPEQGAVVEAVGPGTAHVVAKGDGKTGMSEFVVQGAVTAIEFDKGTTELSAGSSLPLGVVLIASDATKRPLDKGTWGSDKPDIATVAQDGTVTGLSAGQARITLTRDAVTVTQTVYVRDWQLQSIELSADETNLLPEQPATLQVTGHFAEDHAQDITDLFTFSATADCPMPEGSDEQFPITIDGATVAAATPCLNGDSATAVSLEVTATGKDSTLAEGQTASLAVTVVDPDTASVPKIATPAQISAKAEPSSFAVVATYEGADGDVEIETPAHLGFMPEGVVYVDSNSGTIEGLQQGSVTIQVLDEDDETLAETTVAVVDEDASALRIEPAAQDTEPAVDVGSILQLTASASFGDDVAQDVSAPALWTSDDESIAVVSNVTAGRVTGVAAGTATVTARYHGQSAMFEVTVHASQN